MKRWSRGGEQKPEWNNPTPRAGVPPDAGPKLEWPGTDPDEELTPVRLRPDITSAVATPSSASMFPVVASSRPASRPHPASGFAGRAPSFWAKLVSAACVASFAVAFSVSRLFAPTPPGVEQTAGALNPSEGGTVQGVATAGQTAASPSQRTGAETAPSVDTAQLPSEPARAREVEDGAADDTPPMRKRAASREAKRKRSVGTPHRVTQRVVARTHSVEDDAEEPVEGSESIDDEEAVSRRNGSEAEEGIDVNETARAHGEDDVEAKPPPSPGVASSSVRPVRGAIRPGYRP